MLTCYDIFQLAFTNKGIRTIFKGIFSLKEREYFDILHFGLHYVTEISRIFIYLKITKSIIYAFNHNMRLVYEYL